MRERAPFEIGSFEPGILQREENLARLSAGVERTRFPHYVNNCIYISGHRADIVVANVEVILERCDLPPWAGHQANH